MNFLSFVSFAQFFSNGYNFSVIVTLYKCHLLGSHGGRADCSLCMTRERKYQCAWCGTSCSYSESCVDPVATSCPPPHIDWVKMRKFSNYNSTELLQSVTSSQL